MKYMIENENGDTLVGHECKGMGTKYTWCFEFADMFTASEAARLQIIYGGTVVRA